MITELAQVIFTSPNADAWRSFGPDVLGAQLAADGPGGSVRLRIDDVTHRLEIQHGPADDLTMLVWLDPDRGATEASLARQPTFLTVSMVNRLMNLTEAPAALLRWSTVLDGVTAHPRAPDWVQKAARRYLEHQRAR